MTDLIERLRRGEPCAVPCRVMNAASGCDCAEAADEIERLRAACVEWAETSQRNYQRAKAAEAALSERPYIATDAARIAALEAALAPLVALAGAIKADAEKATEGPWAWEVDRKSKRVELCGGFKSTDLTVMSFARYGMSKAAPVFWFWRGNWSDEPKRADALAVPEKGREHHADWFARIDHPDARLLEKSWTMVAAILAAADAAGGEG